MQAAKERERMQIGWGDYAGAAAALMTAMGGAAAAFHYVVVRPTMEKIARMDGAREELATEMRSLRRRSGDDREEVLQRLSSLEAKVDLVLAAVAYRRWEGVGRE